MGLIIKKDAPEQWLLVRVPKITDMQTSRDMTAQRLRESIQEDHFGGENAKVRKLTALEVENLKPLKPGSQ